MLSMELGSINLGQGFPDYNTPDIVVNSSLKALNEGIENNDIAPTRGNPKFLKSFSKVVSKRLNRNIDPENEVFVDVGCSGTYATAAQALLEEGDECIIFEPFFLWHPWLEMIGVKCNVAGFKWDEKEQRLRIDKDQIRSMITPKTKMITVINPNNPDGKLWDKEELEFIREICLENPQIMVFADEVYNLFIFDGREHTPIASLPDMFERTITFYSPGKEMSCTGWRIGVAVGPDYLINPIVEFKRWTGNGAGSNNQLSHYFNYAEAVKPYKGEKDYFTWKRTDYQRRKDRIVDVVSNAQNSDFETIPAEGGYTFNCSIREGISDVGVQFFYEGQELPEDFEEKNKAELNEAKGITEFDEWVKLPNPDLTPDQAFTQWFSRVVGVTTIPVSYLYYNHGVDMKERKGIDQVRFSLCKRNTVFNDLEKALSKEI